MTTLGAQGEPGGILEAIDDPQAKPIKLIGFRKIAAA